MHLYIDFVGNQSVVAITEQSNRIAANLQLMPMLSEQITKQRKTATSGINTVLALGRWIVVYQSSLERQEQALMYWFDFRFNITDIVAKTFSESMAKAILRMQLQYDQEFTSALDSVELTFAETYERVLLPDLFACDQNEQVLVKANQLGVLPILQSLKEGDGVKVCFADEQIQKDGATITDVYALIHFSGHASGSDDQNGFAYLRIRDLKNNLDKIDPLLEMVQKAGGQFDRVAFLERFTLSRYN